MIPKSGGHAMKRDDDYLGRPTHDAALGADPCVRLLSGRKREARRAAWNEREEKRRRDAINARWQRRWHQQATEAAGGTGYLVRLSAHLFSIAQVCIT
jgi:hypothetical protein